MSRLETESGRQFAAVRGFCAECESPWLARDVAHMDSNTVQLALATRRLTTHMRDVVHTDPPRARDYYTSDYDPDRPWGLIPPPLSGSVLAGIP